MKFDRNTVIGFVVLAALFIAYFFYTSKEQSAYMKKKAIEDSIENAKHPKPVLDTVTSKTDSLRLDSLSRINNEGVFKTAVIDSERLVYAENDLVKIAFTNKGGQPKWIELKKYKNQDSSFVKLAGTDFDKITYNINTGPNSSSPVSDILFSEIDSVKTPDSTVIQFTLRSKDSSSPLSVTHRFVLKKNDYMLGFSIMMNGADKLLTQNTLNLTWQYRAAQQESDISFEKQNTQIGYVTNGEFDYHTAVKRSEVNFDKPVKWIGIRQRFFNAFLVANDDFSSGKMEWTMPPDSARTILNSTAMMQIKLPPSMNATIPLEIFYGPDDFHVLKKYDLQFEKLINLGQGLYAFVRPVNRFLIMPIFDFLAGFIGSYGLAIALLTIIIRLLISPLTYTSYLSGAKMKVLRPEIAALKAKYGGDQQQIQMEQMKLFREAGVNPLGGCIPALLQIPIFFALYSFFNSNVALRGQSFLWAKDLSAYDVFINFGVKVPLLGSHLSLFTILAVVTSFLISLYSMSMTPDQSNPLLKYMPYIFPVFLLFIFNNLPSALTWYYTVSNLITLAIQYVIQTYIIDHDKILAGIQENRKKPKTKSKWQEKFEQMQEQQKRLKQTPQKGKR
ncbi:MAG: membrane protein insertase YidC [Chitinophagaceae bacterium]|nr:membrane protein insertase YidC [Chitinophagaceae bacterium]OQY92805.1 MAG: membrane protein insertase YidC [Sphingobacteriales bacterium UTBCD1]